MKGVNEMTIMLHQKSSQTEICEPADLILQARTFKMDTDSASTRIESFKCTSGSNKIQ